MPWSQANLRVSIPLQEGLATSIGEQPLIGLVSASAGARMSLMEALCSLVGAPITALKVRWDKTSLRGTAVNIQ